MEAISSSRARRIVAVPFLRASKIVLLLFFCQQGGLPTREEMSGGGLNLLRKVRILVHFHALMLIYVSKNAYMTALNREANGRQTGQNSNE